VEKIASDINSDTSIEGITVSGGEPLDYACELSYLFALTNPALTKLFIRDIPSARF
jgi:organic radical activating enzyme